MYNLISYGILIVVNKTLPRVTNDGKVKGVLDASFYNLYIPLLELGHTVYFYDTINPVIKDFNDVYDKFKPDLIFCCITGNSQVTPYEPLEKIKEILNFSNIPLIASGGVTSIKDIENLKKLKDKGLSGIIIGKALYENKISLPEVIKIAEN